MNESSRESVSDDAKCLDRSQASAIAGLQRVGATPVALPERYTLEGTFGGSAVDLELTAFRGGPFAWARVTRMRSPGRAQVLNVVAVSALDKNAPCFGAELLVFARGTHLVVLDAWNTGGEHFPVQSALDAASTDLRANWTLEPPPVWGEEVFSSDAIVIRPGARAEAPAAEFAEAFDSVFKAYLDGAYSAPTDKERHLENRRKWLRVQGEEEPAREFLARIAGHAWVKRFTFDVLYPTWLYDADGAPPWEEK